jgi:uncharacterized protein
MAAISNLQQLLQQMQPVLQPGNFVFVTLQQPKAQLFNAAVGIFKEVEGTTLILEQSVADTNGLKYDYVAAWITLTVHSSLAAVGLTAAVTNALAGAGISCNVVAAYYHDHLFVPATDAEKALNVLKALAK